MSLCALAVTAYAEPSETPPVSSSNAIAVINADNRQLLYQNRADDVLAPTASAKLTAMMVVWDQLEKHSVPLDTPIIIDPAALKNIGSAGDLSAPRLGISPGDSYTVSDMISASLVANANDACSALAYYCAAELMGGDMNDFVSLMNAKVKEAGAENTCYVNCTGLNAEGAYTTARDTAMIAAYFYRYSELVRISDQMSFRLNGKSNVHTKNYLLSSQLTTEFYTKEAEGMIAGQNTQQGGYCLITSTVTSDKIKYIFVVMDASGEIRNTDGTRTFGAGNAYADIKALIPWATESFEYRLLVSESDPVAEIKVTQGKNFDYIQLVAGGSLELMVNRAATDDSITRTVIYNEARVYDGDYNGTTAKMIDAPVKKGEQLGKLVFLSDGIVLGEVPLIAMRDIENSGLLNTVGAMKDILFSDTAKTVLIWIGVLVGAFVLISFTAFIIRSSTAAKRRKNREITRSKRDEKGGKGKT